MDYINKNDTIIFSSEYNEPLDINLLSQYKKVIFSNYELSNLHEYFIDNILKNKCSSNLYLSCMLDPSEYDKHRYNYKLNLQNHLMYTFNSEFNQSVDNLPNTLTHITFGYEFNQEINNLPNSVELIQLPKYYDKKILKIPKELKKVICHEKYKFKKDFNNYFVELIKLPAKYDKKILKIPKELKKIICHKNYKFIKDFDNLNMEIYPTQI